MDKRACMSLSIQSSANTKGNQAAGSQAHTPAWVYFGMQSDKVLGPSATSGSAANKLDRRLNIELLLAYHPVDL